MPKPPTRPRARRAFFCQPPVHRIRWPFHHLHLLAADAAHPAAAGALTRTHAAATLTIAEPYFAAIGALLAYYRARPACA